jgi:hypothetical protein
MSQKAQYRRNVNRRQSKQSRRRRTLQQHSRSNVKRLARSKRKKRSRSPSEPNLEKALRFLRAGNSQRVAAKSAGVSVKKLREFVRGNRLAKYKGRRWHFTDKRRRQIVAITTVGERELIVRGFEPASWAMSHRNAVREFLRTADVSLLAPFESASITDTRGRKYFLEVRPNVLYRRASAGGEHYELIYRLVT